MICKYFFPFHWLPFHFLDNFFLQHRSLIFIWSHWSISSFVAFGIYLRKHCITQTDCSKSLTVLALTSMICVCVLSHVWLFAAPEAIARQAPLQNGIFQARVLECGAISCSRGPSRPRIEPMSLASPTLAGGFVTTSDSWEDPSVIYFELILCRVC